MSKNIFIFSVICFTLLFISTNGFPQNSGQYPIINSGYRPYYQTILPAYPNPPPALVSQQNCEGGNCNGKPFCSAGYHLENGVCILDLQCEPGYAIENGKCVPSGRLNCTSTSCANNNCQIVCPLGFVLVNGLCQSKSQPPCEQRTCEIKTVCHPTECTPTVIQPATICPPNSGNIQPPAAVTSCPNNAPSCSIQPVRSIQTIQPVQQIQPVQPTLTVQPAQQIQPVQPIHTVPSVQQIQPVQPIVQPVQPIQIYQPLPSLQPSCNQCPQGQLCPQCPSSQCPQCPQQQGCPQCPPQQPCPACPQQTPCPACIQAPCAPCPTVQCPQCPQQRPCPPCTQQPCAPCPPVQCPQCPPQLPCPSCPLPPPCPTCPTLPPLNITEVICPPGFRKSNGVCLQISCPDKGVYQNGSCTASNTVSSTINTQNVVHNHNVIRQPVKVNINNENTVYIHTADGTVVSVNGTQTEPIRGNITTIQPKACTNSTCQPPPTIVEKPKCCTIVTPRICKKNDTRWDCNNRRYTRCGPICQHPKMYLRPRTVISRPPVLVIPPYCNGPSCNWVEGRDCSGCAAESSCPSYCHAPNCDTGDCGFYDQQQYCEENPGSYGCYEHDGCYDDWCNS